MWQINMNEWFQLDIWNEWMISIRQPCHRSGLLIFHHPHPMSQNIGLRTILVNVKTPGSMSVNSRTLLKVFFFVSEKPRTTYSWEGDMSVARDAACRGSSSQFLRVVNATQESYKLWCLPFKFYNTKDLQMISSTNHFWIVAKHR